MNLDFNIGFLKVSLWDILDILIVAYLLYQLYKLLRGSIAFNIFIGLLLLYGSWFVVNQLNMDLLSSILDQFVKVGIIILIIIFQPEARRFLLILGNTTLRQRSNFLDRILDRGGMATRSEEERTRAQEAILKAVLRMSRHRVGALIVFNQNFSLEGMATGGVVLDAQISQGLVESIFAKESPLHDGAVLIDNLKIQKASTILPVSEQTDLPKGVGLRHRAAVGICEKTNAVALVVSEETGSISFAQGGKLERKLNEERLREVLREFV
ncbi:MAG: TIGR00159 family protein [Bacteroidetes bacterium]|nr:MAG: TIGR00159 family protein [Bacteroidota bacterium]PTM12528.1 MAG: TIGR00159 family protein [Bacteroidota bacterium]